MVAAASCFCFCSGVKGAFGSCEAAIPGGRGGGGTPLVVLPVSIPLNRNSDCLVISGGLLAQAQKVLMLVETVQERVLLFHFLILKNIIQ